MRPAKNMNSVRAAAMKLFFQYGIKRVSVEEICVESGISKVTFYKHYKNKMELAIEIRDNLMKQGFEAYDEISRLDISFIEKMHRTTQWQKEFFAQMDNVFIKEIGFVKGAEEEYKKRFIRNIRKAQETGEIRNDLYTELICLVIKQINELAKGDEWKKICPDFGTYVEEIRKILFFGLLTRPEEYKEQRK